MNIRKILRVIIIICASQQGQAYAGAWPRGEGNVFLSFKNETTLDLQTPASANALYVEYGLSAKTTLSAELRFPTDGSGNLTGYIAVNRLVGMISPSDPFALSARIGFRDLGDSTEYSISPGIHFGHGFETSLGNGWATLDGWLHRPLDGGTPATQIDVQVGARISVNWMLMLSASRYKTDTYEGTKFTPSMAIRIGDDRTIQFSYSEEYGDTPAKSLEAALWMEF